MANEFGPNVLPFPQLQGTVPSSAAAGPDVSSLIGHISDPLTPELIRQATTPIAGPRVPQLPSSMTRPIAPYQQTPFDTREVVGAGNARARGIANAFTGVTNALGTVLTAEAQKKQGEIRDAATKVITAQQAIDEAQQQHDMAIQQGDADTASKMMELIKENQKVRDGVFADPKMRKALAKGFDISYTDPSQNKTEEHQAVMQAMQGAKTREEKQAAIAKLRQEQNAKAGAAAGAAFASSQPRGLAPNTMAMQKLQIAEMEQKAQIEAQKNYATLQASLARSQSTVDAARIRTMGSVLVQQARFQQQDDLLAKRFDMAKQLLGARYSDSLDLMQKRMAASRQLARNIWADKQADPYKRYQDARKAAESYQQNAVKDGDTLVTLMAQRQKEYPSGATGKEASKDPDGYAALNAQIRLAQQAIESDKANAGNMGDIATHLNQIFGLGSGASSSSEDSGGSGNTQPDSMGGSDDWTNPLNYLGGGNSEQP